MKASYKKHTLQFKQASGTSRGILKTKDTYFIIAETNGKKTIGECGILKGLSFDDVPQYEQKLAWTCQNINLGRDKLWEELKDFPSIQFGVEQVFLALENKQEIYTINSDFSKGNQAIEINGLVWMGQPEFMKSQIDEKIAQGFKCIKMKIGAIDFAEEYKLLTYIRSEFSHKKLELRVDANGGFSYEEAPEILNKLAALDIHSIEQPIQTKQSKAMQKLCSNTPLPIALDEELIGITTIKDKEYLLKTIQPQYIILKPSLIGGIKGSLEWISIAENLNIGWWVTSALESNIGLNAIAQFTYELNNLLPQGLGTGSLYTNNIDSPLEIKNGHLHYNPLKKWNLELF